MANVAPLLPGDPGRLGAYRTISLCLTGLLRARMFWQDTGDPGNVAAGALTRG
jgi:hypothetical protein